MERTNYALFVDLENCGGKSETLQDVIEKVKIRGDILLGKVYGYSESYSNLKELLLSNTFNVVPSIRWGYNQKNNLDIQLVIDALEVAYKNDLIDCFCIVSGDSDYTPLVGKLKSMGKYVLGISRSEVASKVFINACSEFIFLERVTASRTGKKAARRQTSSGATTTSAEDLNALVVRILGDLDSVDYLYASELKKTVSRLMPEFDERSFGFTSFGKLLLMLAQKYHMIRVVDDNHALKVYLSETEILPETAEGSLTRSNWKQVFAETLQKFKEEGFDRVNPSIVKGVIQQDYPGFEEKELGFSRFSDLMRELEKDRIVHVEMDESHSMLLKIL